MSGKLKCVIVDDFYPTLVELQKLCQDLPHVEIIETFSSPKKFLEVSPVLDYDLCLLDIFMPEMDGITVSKMMRDKPVIFMTDIYDRLKEAVDLINPIDVITKPIKKARLQRAFEKAYKIITHVPAAVKSKEFELFHAAEAEGRIKLHLSDILFVKTDEANCRNKRVYLKNGEHYTIRRCTNEQLLKMSPKLVQVNKAELVSVDAIKGFKHNFVTLKHAIDQGMPVKVTLNRNFRTDFVKKMHN
jgi:two-component system LytT family response regulator